MATAVLVTLPLVACGGSDENPVDPDAVPKAGAAASSEPDAAQPQKPINRPPTVKVRFVGDSTCHPRRPASGLEPCTVEVRAVASDPDGDALTYSWKGCTSGRSQTAACVVDSPSTFTAAVEVGDGRGGTARDSVSITGLNRPPTAVMTPHGPPFRAGQPVEIFGNVYDPDDGFVCGRQWCVRAEASGACGPSVFLDCACLGDLYLEVRPHSAGTCTVTVTLKDDWGLEGQGVLRFDVIP